MNHHTLKGLQTARSRLDAEISRIKGELDKAQRELKEIQSQIKQLTKRVVASEHAILRFLERKRGINIDEIKEEILSDTLKGQIEQLGSGKFPIGDGLRAIVKQNVIVSIISD